jgi:hypothetical protein
VHPHQARHQDRKIELSGDSLGHGRVARLQGQTRDVAVADGRQRGQAEVMK